MTIILNSLKEPFDKVALPVKFGVKRVFHLEIGFVGNANSCPVRMEERVNFIARVSAVCENYLARKLEVLKQFKYRFRVVKIPCDTINLT